MKTFASRLPSSSVPRRLFAAVLCAVCLAAAPAWGQQSAGVPGVNLRQAADEVRQSDSRISQAGALDVLFGAGTLSDPLFFSALKRQTTGNTALVRQESQSTGNVANLTQRGLNNLAVLFQLGDDNDVTLEQKGAFNLFGVRLRGDDNVLDVEQDGNFNTYVLDYDAQGVPLQTPAVQQVGNGNTAVQTGRGGALFGIEQRGNDMNITIRHNQ